MAVPTMYAARIELILIRGLVWAVARLGKLWGTSNVHALHLRRFMHATPYQQSVIAELQVRH